MYQVVSAGVLFAVGDNSVCNQGLKAKAFEKMHLKMRTRKKIVPAAIPLALSSKLNFLG